LVAEVSQSPEFAKIKPRSLRKAVHRAIDYGVKKGRFRTTTDETDPFKRTLIARC
jgi:hypothetical protein